MIAIPLLLSANDKPAKYWIYFASKDNTPLLQKGASKKFAASIGLSERAIQRHLKMGLPAVSENDLPVSPRFVSELQGRGIRIENELRWFNAVTAYLTPEQAGDVVSLPFVLRVEPVRTFTAHDIPRSNNVPDRSLKKIESDRYDYGLSLAQMQSINAVAVHNIGISGRGVLIGMLDSGFRWKAEESLQNTNVVAEYDFIQKDGVTANQEGDSNDQDWHGTYTMSLVGGYKEGKLASPAFNASFILGKTEYVPSETNIEEDNWAAAIEWMEQNGVDVVSSSLGYSEFDATDSKGNPQHSYVYADMNGKTAVTTKAAIIAARKGVVVVSAMGNEAQSSWHFLTAPADADSIISVGAVNTSGTYAPFSSVGPTSDGRTKPDVSADGVSVYGVNTFTNGYTTASGTSAATPLVAGVAAMILSAHPELTPIQVRDALRNTASNPSAPNNSIGWGVVDAYKAVLYNGMVIGTDPMVSLTTDNSYEISTYIVSHNVISKNSVELIFTTDQWKTTSSTTMMLTDVIDSNTYSGRYSVVLPPAFNGSDIDYYIQAHDNSSVVRTSPHDAPAEYYNVKTSLKGGNNPFAPTEYSLSQNYPNPFNPSTTIKYYLPAAGHITLTIFDMLGRKIETLVDGVKLQGNGSVLFTASHLSSGVYFYRLTTSTFTQTKKMIFIK